MCGIVGFSSHTQRAWNLKENGGTVTLHCIVLVFHGGDVALCEEI